MREGTTGDGAVLDCVELGKDCSVCGTHHKRVSGLPKKALTRKEIAELKEGDSIAFVEALYYGPGGDMLGVNDTVQAADDIIVATETSARHISFDHQHEEWIVITNEPKECDCCSPREHGANVLLEITTSMKKILYEEGDLEQNPMLAFGLATGISWPVEELNLDDHSFPHPPWES